MSHIVANAIDWYVDKLNKAHFLPTNLATLIRDISAKQIGGRGFTPRPMTEDSFTDDELESVYRLAKDPKGGFRKHISYDTYKDVGGSNVIGNGRLFRYLAPLKTVQTTIGQATLNGEGDDTVLTDTYDFNRREEKQKVFDHGDGTLSFRNKNYGNKIERYPRGIVSSILIGKRLRGGTYGHIRHNAARLGHISEDPDADKIKIRLSMNEIEKRLRARLENRFAWNIGGTGAAVGAPIGAVLGAISGAVMLLDKSKRKRWLKTMLTHVLGGAAAAAAVGGLGGWALARDVNKRFNTASSFVESEKKASEEDRGQKKNKKNKKARPSILIPAMAYSLPLAALAGVGAYGMKSLKDWAELMMRRPGDLNSQGRDSPVEYVSSLNDL